MEETQESQDFIEVPVTLPDLDETQIWQSENEKVSKNFLIYRLDTVSDKREARDKFIPGNLNSQNVHLYRNFTIKWSYKFIF